MKLTNKALISHESESEVSQLCPTLCNPMDCSPPGSFHPWNFLGQSTRVGCHFLLQGIFPTWGSNLSLLHGQAASLPLSQLAGEPLPVLGSCLQSFIGVVVCFVFFSGLWLWTGQGGYEHLAQLQQGLEGLCLGELCLPQGLSLSRGVLKEFWSCGHLSLPKWPAVSHLTLLLCRVIWPCPSVVGQQLPDKPERAQPAWCWVQRAESVDWKSL